MFQVGSIGGDVIRDLAQGQAQLVHFQKARPGIRARWSKTGVTERLRAHIERCATENAYNARYCGPGFNDHIGEVSGQRVDAGCGRAGYASRRCGPTPAGMPLCTCGMYTSFCVRPSSTVDSTSSRSNSGPSWNREA